MTDALKFQVRQKWNVLAKRNHLTTEKLAKAAGLSPSALYNDHVPQAKTLIKISQVVGLSPGQLLDFLLTDYPNKISNQQRMQLDLEVEHYRNYLISQKAGEN